MTLSKNKMNETPSIPAPTGNFFVIQSPLGERYLGIGCLCNISIICEQFKKFNWFCIAGCEIIATGIVLSEVCGVASLKCQWREAPMAL